MGLPVRHLVEVWAAAPSWLDARFHSPAAGAGRSLTSIGPAGPAATGAAGASDAGAAAEAAGAATTLAAGAWAAGFEQATSAAAHAASVTRFVRIMSSSPDAAVWQR